MAIDLQNSQNIATGWGAPPKFDAPAIGSTLSAILENRRVQQALQQKQIADAVKQIQEQRQSSAYAEALRNAGLTQGQDISGLGSTDATHLATLIQANAQDPLKDAYTKALTNAAQARADALNDPSTDDTTTLDPAEQRRQDAEKRREVSDQIKASQAQMKLNQSTGTPHALAPGEKVVPGTYPFDVNGKRVDVPQSQIDQFNAARRVYDVLTKQRAGVPQPAPADRTQTGGGVSSGGTTLASPNDIRMARARQAMDDPQATPAEKEQARKILAGG